MTFRMDKTAAETLVKELNYELDYWLYDIEADAMLSRKALLLAIADLYDALGDKDAEDIRYRVAEVEKEYKQSEEYKKRNPHGEVVGYRQDPWHDVTIYEDGYEDRFYIGE